VSSPPKIVGPLGPCSETIRLRGQVPGNIVMVHASLTNVFETLCKTQATAPDEVFALSRPLQPGENVITQGSTSVSPAEIVQQRPAPGTIGRVAGLTHPFACGECLWLSNGTPGATVEVRDAGGVLRGRGPAPDGNARFPISKPIGHNETLFATQFVCGVPGPQLSLVPSDEPPSRDRVLEPPRIVGTLHHCDSAVRVEGVVEGATVTLTIDGEEFTSCFDRSALWFTIGRELETGQRVNVRQSFERCELHSEPSKDVFVEELLQLDAPYLFGPLCKGTRFVTVGNLIPGSIVTIEQDGLQIGEGCAWDSVCDFVIEPLVYRYHSKVTATQTRCGLTSSPSYAVEVRKLHAQLPAPVVVGPLVECGAAVRVTNLHRGARVDVVSAKLGVIGTAFTWAEEIDITVSPALGFPDDISVLETACGNVVRSSNTVQTFPHPQLLPPGLSRPTWNTRPWVPVDNVVPGAWVDVSLDGIHSGSAPATSSRVNVPLGSKPRSGQVVRARQRLCDLVSEMSAETVVRAIDDYDVHPVVGTVSRVCQLTGGYDPEQLPHRNNTDGFGVVGTDLGISVDRMWAGEHRTYFFFGDTNGAYDDVGDSIFYTTDDDPEPFGPLFTCVTVTDEDDDDFGTFARLGVDGVSLPGFGVPTGAFAWGGRTYLFVATDFENDDNAMRRSVLGSAADPAQGFINHGDVDWQGKPGFDFRFINISPWVIANDEWEGLPDNALPGHHGVLLCGSGHYRKSSPYLAYVPIEQVTAPRNGWRYFTRTAPQANGHPWSPNMGDASPLFVDDVVGELSFSHHPDLQKWLLLYNSPGSSGSIVIRSATVPWGDWSGPAGHKEFDPYPNELVLFNNPMGFRKFIHEDGKDSLGDLPPDISDTGGAIYGPYIVSRWNRWNDNTQKQQIYFTMSTWVPYQPQLMRAHLELVHR
jgi:hypothetical protein